MIPPTPTMIDIGPSDKFRIDFPSYFPRGVVPANDPLIIANSVGYFIGPYLFERVMSAGNPPWMELFQNLSTTDLRALDQDVFDTSFGMMPTRAFRSQIATAVLDDRFVADGVSYMNFVRAKMTEFLPKWDALFQMYTHEDLRWPIRSLNYTETYDETTSTDRLMNETNANTRTFDTTDVDDGWFHSSDANNLKMTETPLGTQTDTTTRTGNFTQTPMGKTITEDEGITDRQYVYGFDTPSGMDDPGQSSLKRGVEKSSTVSFQERKDTTTYNDLKDERKITFTDRKTETQHEDKYQRNSSDHRNMTKDGTIGDEGNKHIEDGIDGTAHHERTITGYRDVNVISRFEEFRKLWAKDFFAMVEADFLSWFTTGQFAWGL